MRAREHGVDLSPYSSFDDWVAQEEMAGAFTAPETAETYRYIWTAWLRWLPPGVAWYRAEKEHVTSFLDGPAPGIGKKRPPKTEKVMANATRYRYWRVLRAVYFAADKAKKLVADNPALLGADEPGQLPDMRQAQVLPPFALDILRDPEALAALIPAKTEPPQWWVVRDRAAVALLAHCGLTTSELVNLTGADLIEGVDVMRANITLSLPGMGPPVVQVRVQEVPTRSNGRTLPVPPEMLKLLRAWLCLRDEVLQSDVNRLLIAGVEPGAIPRMVNYPLFLSRQRAGSAIPLGALEAQTLYLSVRRCLVALYKHPEVKSGIVASHYVAKGAAIIRNTVVAEWSKTLGDAEAVQRAGLRSANSLRVPGSSAAKA